MVMAKIYTVKAVVRFLEKARIVLVEAMPGIGSGDVQIDIPLEWMDMFEPGRVITLSIRP